MSLFDDAPRERPQPHHIGQDLSRLSIDELRERIDLLETEIQRLKQAIDEKSASHKAASNIFRTK